MLITDVIKKKDLHEAFLERVQGCQGLYTMKLLPADSANGTTNHPNNATEEGRLKTQEQTLQCKTTA